MRKSKLDAHTAWITNELLNGTSIMEIRDGLATMDCDVKHETVRKWIKSRKLVKFVAHKRGRPKSKSDVSFCILAKVPTEDEKKEPLPACLMLFSVFVRSNDDGTCAAEALAQIGIVVDPKVPKREWILPAARLKALKDLELCLLAYLVSDMQVPPVEAHYPVLAEWFSELIGITGRLKTAIAVGGSIRVGSLLEANTPSEDRNF